MLLGARQFFERRAAPAWTNPYVTDGLVAMWDGEWNAGGGKLSSVNEALDLSGNGHDGVFWGAMIHEGNYFISPKVDNSIVRGALYSVLSAEEVDSVKAGCTMECVIESCPQSLFSYESLYHRFMSVCGFLTCGQFVNGNVFYGLPTWAGNCNLGGFGSRMALTMLSVGNSAEITNHIGATRTWDVSGTQSKNYFGLTSIDQPSNYNYAEAGCKYFSYRLYSRALTTAEIAANYAIDQARFNLP